MWIDLNDQYYADFETTTSKNNEKDGFVRVLAWGMISTSGEYYSGRDMDTFLSCIRRLSDNKKICVHFHNLKFDFSFIEWHLLNSNSGKPVPFGKYRESNGGEWEVLRSKMGAIFCAVYHINESSSVKFIDTSKIFPGTLVGIGESVGIEKLKGDFDFNRYFPEDYVLTEKESKYLYHDCLILRKAMTEHYLREGAKRQLIRFYGYYDGEIEEIVSKLTFTNEEGLPIITLSDYPFEVKERDKGKIVKMNKLPAYQKLTRSSYAYSELVDTIENRPKTREEKYYINKGRFDDMRLYGIKKNGKPRKRYKSPSDFYSLFPKLDYETWQAIQFSYFGGHTMVNPIYKGSILDGLTAIDINSSYPSQMVRRRFPVGYPLYFKGKYDGDTSYPLYIQRFKCKFKIKENGFPTLPKKLLLKSSYEVVLTHKDIGEIELSLTNVDMEHFLRNYDVWDIHYIDGLKFSSIDSPFKDFILRHNKGKVDAQLRGDWLGRQAEKLTNNMSYGKFGTAFFQSMKIARLETGVLKYDDVPDEKKSTRSDYYNAVASFITAYGRDTLFNMIYEIGIERFVYCDTDSVHFIGELSDIPSKYLDDSELGKWSLDASPDKGKYLRAKAYMYQEGDEITIKAAGITDEAKEKIKESENPFDEFALGKTYSGNFMLKNVVGGVLLTPIEKELKVHIDDPDRFIENGKEIFDYSEWVPV